MTPAVIALLVCASGGIGAAARLVLDVLIRSRIRSSYPVATTTINLTGSLLLGLLTGLAAGRLLPEPWLIIAGTGLLGGYTTFSTASVELVRLVRDDRRWTALGLAAGMLVLSLAAAAAGLWLGSR